jgi:hypothetical protein
MSRIVLWASSPRHVAGAESRTSLTGGKSSIEYLSNGRRKQALRGSRVRTGVQSSSSRLRLNGKEQDGSSAHNGSVEYGKVQVTFRVHKCCEFGKQVGVVGSLPGLGSWDANQSFALEWNDGHIWSGSVVIPLDQLLMTPSVSSHCIEYKYIVQSSTNPTQAPVEWMPGENLHVPSLEYGTTSLTVQDTWGFGYREIQVERLAEERMQEMIRQEEQSTRKALGSMVQNAMRELSDTLTYCESIIHNMSQDDAAHELILNADRELAASTDKATRMLRANAALFYMDSV